MKFYKNSQNVVYAFEADGSQDAFIPSDLVAITEAEADALRAPVPVVVVPAAVSRRQGRLALLEVGKLDAVEGMIAAITDPVQKRRAEIEYEADTWERSNAFLQQSWGLMGGSSDGLDDIFVLAATL